MINLNINTKKAARYSVAGAPEGVDAQVLATLASPRDSRPILMVARDDARLARLLDLLRFFAPDLRVLDLPAWDCLPYDRSSPNGEIVARRLATLSVLADASEQKPRIVVTTVSAILQRVPPRSSLRDSVFALGEGDHLDREALLTFFARNGYHRAETVREPGEYGLRGSIIDLYPAGAQDPLRLDLFGDEIEAIRTFDPVSQRTNDRRDTIVLHPVSEIPLDPAAISRFRTGYRELAQRAIDDDPLYEAISAGRRYPGMEHWLPLFHERLETVFDYLGDSPLMLDPQFDEARDARLSLIREYYDARAEMVGAAEEGAPYYPVPVQSLSLDEEEWAAEIAGRAVIRLTSFSEPDAIDAGGKAGRDFAPERTQPGVNVYDAVRAHLTALLSAGRRPMIAAYSLGSLDRLTRILAEHGVQNLRVVERWAEVAKLAKNTVAITVLGIERGFEWSGLAIISEQDILGDRLVRAGARRRRAEDFIRDAGVLAVGDLVVHNEHGIGRFDGLLAIEVDGAPHDCLRLVYEGGDKLFLPVEHLDLLSRFGSEEATASLDRLGGTGWQARKARIKGRLRDMADELIKIAAARALHHLEPMPVEPGPYYEFCSRFPFAETEDQQRAIEDVLADLAAGQPMDRLVCGDVGFGKTEVALRAAFTAAMAGFQVAVVVPTTLLARQHFQTFRERFKDFPIRVGQLSRLVNAKDAATVRADLADGSLDIVIGTHALLGKSISFADLGLLIVDEEQHFGVKQKERLKQLRSNVHVLTLTATPIPRTLQLALTGVRDLSLIASPPVDRLAVRTFILAYDPVVAREAIQREQFRGGQTFYVCPRIEDLKRVRERIERLVPEAKVVTAHGQMAARELEAAVTAFYDGAYDILLSTNIIESGLDLPRVNTLIVHRADMFGLAQLYQLRGRVGRAKQRAYAYLTLPPGKVLTAGAEKRLHVMQTLDTLGAGFSLASYDLDIRGAGNLLGEEQSGHIREVGIELYQQLLEEAVADARAAAGEATVAHQEWSPQITIGMPVLIPEDYVPDLGLRLSLYRRVAALHGGDEIDSFAAEMADRFGPVPDEVNNLLKVVAIKALCRTAGVDKIEAGPKGALVSFRDDKVADPARLVRFIEEAAGLVKLRPDMKLVYRRSWESVDHRVNGVIDLMRRLAKLAA